MLHQPETIPALCIRQPWAHCIMHLGKDVENRTWATNYRGPLAIVASKAFPRNALHEACAFIAVEVGAVHADRMMAAWATMRCGGIIGTVDVVDCVDEIDSPWFVGPYGFVLKNPIATPFVPYKGQLGMFKVPRAMVPGLGS